MLPEKRDDNCMKITHQTRAVGSILEKTNKTDRYKNCPGVDIHQHAWLCQATLFVGTVHLRFSPNCNPVGSSIKRFLWSQAHSPGFIFVLGLSLPRKHVYQIQLFKSNSDSWKEIQLSLETFVLSQLGISLVFFKKCQVYWLSNEKCYIIIKYYYIIGVSKNSGIPKWMVYNGKTLLKLMIWGHPYFPNTHILYIEC